MRYCRYNDILCEFATEYGYCQVTACVKHLRMIIARMWKGEKNDSGDCICGTCTCY